MSTTAVAIYSIQETAQIAETIAKSGLFGIKDQTQAMALMFVAQAEGRHPATVARDYHIVSGRPTLKADAMMARFQEAGGRVKWIECSDTKAEAVFSHPHGGELKMDWTIEQAKKANLLLKPGPWHQYPRAMLRARLISEAIRTVLPGVLVGTYTPEEVMDFTEPTKEPVKLSKQLFTSQPRQVPEAIQAEVVDTSTGEILAVKPEQVKQATAINGAGEAKAEPATVPQVGEWDFLGADKLLVELYSKNKGYIMPMDTLDDLAPAMKLKLKSQGPKVIAQAKAWEATENTKQPTLGV